MLEVDHGAPLAWGGNDELANLTTSCRDCNAGKSDQRIDLKYPDGRGAVIACPTRHRIAIIAAVGKMSYATAMAVGLGGDPEIEKPPRRADDQDLVAGITENNIAALWDMLDAIHGKGTVAAMIANAGGLP